MFGRFQGTRSSSNSFGWKTVHVVICRPCSGWQALRSVAFVQVKGKTEPVEIFTLIGAKNDRAEMELPDRLETYEAGFRKFRERHFAQAKILFSQFLEFYPEDALAENVLERALEYEEQPPDEAWNAVEIFKKK